MMTELKRRSVLVGAVACLLLALPVLALLELQSARASAEIAADNARACHQIGQKIQRLQQEPARAGTEARATTELAKGVEEAAQFAQLTEQNVLRVTPQPPRRVGDTAYKEQPTHVQVHGASLLQLTRMLHFLTEQSKLNVSSLRLSAPRQATAPVSAAAERWDAEVTLTYLYFEPKTPPSR